MFWKKKNIKIKAVVIFFFLCLYLIYEKASNSFLFLCCFFLRYIWLLVLRLFFSPSKNVLYNYWHSSTNCLFQRIKSMCNTFEIQCRVIYYCDDKNNTTSIRMKCDCNTYRLISACNHSWCQTREEINKSLECFIVVQSSFGR